MAHRRDPKTGMKKRKARPNNISARPGSMKAEYMRNRTREQLSPEETQIMVINHLMSTLFRPRRIPLSEVLERIGKAAEKSQKRREKAWLMENLMLNGVPKKVLRKHEEDIKRLQNFYEFLRDPRISKENRKAIWREINEIVASIKKDIGETHEKR